MALGVNFYNKREWWKKAFSGVIVTINILICELHSQSFNWKGSQAHKIE